MRNKTVSVRLDSETLERLGAIAKATDRPRAWLMAHAIQRGTLKNNRGRYLPFRRP